MNTLRTAYMVLVSLLGVLLAAPAVVLALPFWAVSALTRTLARRLEPETASWQELVTFDPEIGWRPKANVDAHFAIEGDEVFHVVTDSAGWPGRGGLAESQIVVFGDSMAFGYGVDSAKSYWALIRNVRAKAVSAPGYNLVQQLLLMRQIAPALGGKVVVWFIYHGNDLYDNLSPVMGGPYRMPFLRESGGGGWSITTDHLSPQRWRYSSHRHRSWEQDLASLYSPTFLAKRAYAACDFLLGEARKVCDAVGARLAVYSIPSPYAIGSSKAAWLVQRSPAPDMFDADFPDRQLGEICRRHGVPFVAGKSHLSVHDYKTVDDHWNERGHQRVADALGRIYRDHAAGPMTSLGPVPRTMAESGAGT